MDLADIKRRAKLWESMSDEDFQWCENCEWPPGGGGVTGFCDVHDPWPLAEAVPELLRLLDEAQLRDIQARNPGIDIDEVKRFRAGLSI